MKKIYVRPEITIVKVEAEAFMAATTRWTDGEDYYPIKEDEMPSED